MLIPTPVLREARLRLAGCRDGPAPGTSQADHGVKDTLGASDQLWRCASSLVLCLRVVNGIGVLETVRVVGRLVASSTRRHNPMLVASYEIGVVEGSVVWLSATHRSRLASPDAAGYDRMAESGRGESVTAGFDPLGC